jgi:flagellar biosynthesis/type III secretory pathway M-ring protein FliF/YscJ
VFETADTEEDEIETSLKDLNIKTENENATKVSQLISANPEKAVQIMRKWMMQKS